VVQIWPGLFVCKQVTVCPGHIWTTLYFIRDSCQYRDWLRLNRGLPLLSSADRLLADSLMLRTYRWTTVHSKASGARNWPLISHLGYALIMRAAIFTLPHIYSWLCAHFNRGKADFTLPYKTLLIDVWTRKKRIKRNTKRRKKISRDSLDKEFQLLRGKKKKGNLKLIDKFFITKLCPRNRSCYLFSSMEDNRMPKRAFTPGEKGIDQRLDG
jgi:hypothetical protein